MELTLSYPLYIRTSPSNDEPPIGLLDESDVIDVSNIVIGKSLDGKSVWYQSANKEYYWSGGIENVDFTFAGSDINSLSQTHLMSFLSEAIEYCWSKYKNITWLTGIFIGEKFTDGKKTLDASLVFQVAEKKDVTGSEKIPSNIFFKGFSIPTDVIPVKIALFDAQPGDTCSRINVLDVWGSVGVKVRRKERGREFFYFLTNYHVAASNLIRSGVLSYRFPQELGERQMVVPSQFSDPDNLEFIGALQEGVLSFFHDTALILLSDPSSCINRLPDGNLIDGGLDVFNDASFVGKPVTIYGAISKGKSNTIRSVNSTQRFEVEGRVHEMKQLIQIEKFSLPGDSGSVVTIGNKIIGIHVGSDDQFSYAIPIMRILNFFNIQIA